MGQPSLQCVFLWRVTFWRCRDPDELVGLPKVMVSPSKKQRQDESRKEVKNAANKKRRAKAKQQPTHDAPPATPPPLPSSRSAPPVAPADSPVVSFADASLSDSSVRGTILQPGGCPIVPMPEVHTNTRWV